MKEKTDKWTCIKSNDVCSVNDTVKDKYRLRKKIPPNHVFNKGRVPRIKNTQNSTVKHQTNQEKS
jgi:hypothetical protein